MTRDQFLQLADLLPEPTLLVTSEAAIVAANRAARAQLHLAARQSDAARLSDVTAQSQDELRRYLRLCARSRQMLPGAVSVKHPDGEGEIAFRAQGAAIEPGTAERPALILLRLVPKPAAVGRFLALNQRIDDLSRAIHERKLAQEALHQQKERLRVTLRSIGDAVIVTDDAGRVESLNPVAEAMTGWSDRDARGRPLPEVFHIVNEQTRHRVENPVEMVLREGTTVGLANHTVLLARDGTELPIDDSAAPIRDLNGTLLGVVLVFRDVTARREAERKLKHSEEESRRRAEELAEADRRKNEFLATLAHELRNPLAPLRNTLELLQRAGGQADLARQASSIMQRQMEQMVRLVDDLLDISRITRGLFTLRIERVLLSDVVANAIETTRPLIEADGHQLEVRLPGEPIAIDADPLRIGQVLANLLNNAAKYTPEPGRISVSAERHGDDVAIEVADTGIGLEGDELDRIFDMFYRVDQSLERSHGGLGIGLTLVRRLVEMHGGRVSAASDGRGKGSRFTVRLPVAAGLQAAADAAEPHAPAAPGNRLNLLVIDDNRDSADSLALLLRSMGHDCRAAYHGEMGLRLADELRPDVVFLDIGMPGMSGYQVVRRLREHPALRHVMVIAVSGWGQEEDRRRGREAGFNMHLVKPLDPRELEQLLTRLREGSQ